jgi:hypothetical protein
MPVAGFVPSEDTVSDPPGEPRDGWRVRGWRLAACGLAIGAMASIATDSQSRTPSTPVLYEGGRLIIGDGSAPVDGGAFVVQDGRITALGRKGAVTAPPGASRVDLTGKTVMPALVNAHAHFGYERFTRAAGEALPGNFTPENLLDHLQREAFYGVGTAIMPRVVLQRPPGTGSTPASFRPTAVRTRS